MVLPTLQRSVAFLSAMRRSSVRASGFTIIELLVVITIVGILASAVMFSLNSARQRGRDAQRIADIQSIQLALGQYYDANDRYPATIAPANNSPLVTGGYLPSMPLDPLSKTMYSYAAFVSTVGAGTAICSSYHLGADLEISGNSELRTDSDSYVSYSGSAALTGETLLTNASLCFGSPPDFHGTDTGGSKCNASDIGTVCYDIRP
jgi:general secretion pathway protein G